MAAGATLEEGDPGEAELVLGVLLHNLVIVLRALAAAESLGEDRDGGRHATGGLVGELDASLRLPLELLQQLAGEGTAHLGGQRDTVASELKLRLGEQALAGARDITNLVVVVVTAEAAELVLQEVGALKLDPLAVKEHTDLGRLENHNIVLGPKEKPFSINFLLSCKKFNCHSLDDLSNNVALAALDGVPLSAGNLNGAAVDLNNDMLTLRLHGDISATNEHLDLLLSFKAARGLKRADKDTIGHGLGAITGDEVEAVIHVSLGGAVIKGSDVLALQGAHRVDRLTSDSLDAHGDGVSDIRHRVQVGEGVGHGHIPVLVLLLRAGDIGDLNIVGATGRVDSSPHLHLKVV